MSKNRPQLWLKPGDPLPEPLAFCLQWDPEYEWWVMGTLESVQEPGTIWCRLPPDPPVEMQERAAQVREESS